MQGIGHSLDFPPFPPHPPNPGPLEMKETQGTNPYKVHIIHAVKPPACRAPGGMHLGARWVGFVPGDSLPSGHLLLTLFADASRAFHRFLVSQFTPALKSNEAGPARRGAGSWSRFFF